MWWLVAPHNPLKSEAGMLPFHERLIRARAFARGHGVTVTGLEEGLTHFTVDTVVCLKRRAPHTRFVWLMGADNFATVHLWKRWQGIFETIPVAVFDRAPYSLSSLASRAAIRYRHCRIPGYQARTLATRTPPAWTLILGPRHGASATAIRSGEGRFVFAGMTNGNTIKGRSIHSS